MRLSQKQVQRCLCVCLSIFWILNVPVATGADTSPATKAGIVLDRDWQSPLRGESATMKDLGVLLSPFVQPAANIAAAPNLEIYRSVKYLMPYDEAKKVLHLDQKIIPKAKVACPGFPKDSFYSYAFNGNFEGMYNLLYIVTDKADQVVAIQLVAEAPKRGMVEAPKEETKWHTYNFVNSKSRALTTVWIDHKTQYETQSNTTLPGVSVGLLQIDSLLLDPDDHQDLYHHHRMGEPGAKWKPLEAVRLYLPQPMMELILHCLRSKQH